MAQASPNATFSLFTACRIGKPAVPKNSTLDMSMIMQLAGAPDLRTHAPNSGALNRSISPPTSRTTTRELICCAPNVALAYFAFEHSGNPGTTVIAQPISRRRPTASMAAIAPVEQCRAHCWPPHSFPDRSCDQPRRRRYASVICATSKRFVSTQVRVDLVPPNVALRGLTSTQERVTVFRACHFTPDWHAGWLP